MSWGSAKPSRLYWKKKEGIYRARGWDAQYNPLTLTARLGSFVFLKKVRGKLLICYCPGTYFSYTVEGLLKGNHAVTHVSDAHCSLDKFTSEGLKAQFKDLYRLQADLNLKGIRHTTKDGYRRCIASTLKTIERLKSLGAGWPVAERKKLQKAENARVDAANARYTERAKAARAQPRSERDPITIFKAELLENSWRNSQPVVQPDAKPMFKDALLENSFRNT